MDSKTGPDVLALRELEAFTSSRLTSLLTFAHALIASEETVCFERRAEFAVLLLKSTCETERHCFCLAYETAAVCCSNDVDLVTELHLDCRCECRNLEELSREVAFEVLAVYSYLASAFGEAHASNRSLTTAGA